MARKIFLKAAEEEIHTEGISLEQLLEAGEMINCPNYSTCLGRNILESCGDERPCASQFGIASQDPSPEDVVEEMSENWGENSPGSRNLISKITKGKIFSSYVGIPNHKQKNA
ncbi:MAG: hypothetical protein CO139_02365 [Candidatus Moranbacteria bacterium CG_4_9_14_3_um_filter_36_9]|nr:MAG: hypothetical protein CO139_02365 [Candidatus Moranbacteria bacterium CG_4_9_14_3_um_filter_36_9]